MNLLLPDSGLLFWMTIIFAIVFFIVAKFGFPVITGMAGKRADKIAEGLRKAEEAEKQFAELSQKCELMLKETKEKQAAILHAEAKKEAMLREAEGEAEAIRRVKKAEADGIRLVKEAAPDAAVLQLRSLDAFEKAADGKATKIIIPSNLAGLAGTLQGVVSAVDQEAAALVQTAEK